MNRLHLRLYQPPPEPSPALNAHHEERDIIPMNSRRQTTIISGRMEAPADRARIIHENAVCPECSKTNIEPLELKDAIISPKSRLPIPGTATIVGFHCTDCTTEWPVYQLSVRLPG